MINKEEYIGYDGLKYNFDTILIQFWYNFDTILYVCENAWKIHSDIQHKTIYGTIEQYHTTQIH